MVSIAVETLVAECCPLFACKIGHLFWNRVCDSSWMPCFDSRTDSKNIFCWRIRWLHRMCVYLEGLWIGGHDLMREE